LKKVISYSLYGDNPRYTIGAIKNAVLAKQYMPEWECRFYIDEQVPSWVIQTLGVMDNCKIIYIRFEELRLFKMTYRFLVFADPEVDVAIVRDVDSRISARDIMAVEDWLKSDFSFHIMKDHPVGHGYLISGGMFGGRTDKLRDMQKKLLRFFHENPYYIYGADQTFLAEEVYPFIKDDCLYHSDHYDCNPVGNSIQRGFPTEDRFPDNHIGAALNENDEYVFPFDAEHSIQKNKINRYVYDFDLLENV
jgi:protein O-GlcNAc transferase